MNDLQSSSGKVVGKQFLVFILKIQPFIFFSLFISSYWCISLISCNMRFFFPLCSLYLQLMTVSVSRLCVTFCTASYLGITAAGNNSKINTWVHSVGCVPTQKQLLYFSNDD